MTTAPPTEPWAPARTTSGDPSRTSAGATAALAACFLAMFVITLDAVVVNVALPPIRADLGGGMTGLQWVVDGYTLLFAALLLSAGSISDRVGARTAFATGVLLFVAGSIACGLAPTLPALVVSRFLQGAAAALVMPSSMALVRQTFPDPARRARAIGVWAMGGAVASSSGPVLGGLLSLASWRLIFFVNVPAGVVALALLARTAKSPTRQTPFDWTGQVAAVVAMGALTFGAIEAGARGMTSPLVLTALGIAMAAFACFLLVQRRGPHPMVPLDLFRSRTVSLVVVIGFAFMACYYGLPFVMSLYLQQQRGLTSLEAGAAFVPMMLVGAALTPLSARLVDYAGARRVIGTGLLLMTFGLVALAAAPSSAPVWVLSALMVLVGVAGPTVMPPATAALLNAVPGHQAGTASGVLNTSRQLGGALAVAVFGALLASPDAFTAGMRTSLLLAAAVALATAAGTTALLHRQSADLNSMGPDLPRTRWRGRRPTGETFAAPIRGCRTP